MARMGFAFEENKKPPKKAEEQKRIKGDEAGGTVRESSVPAAVQSETSIASGELPQGRPPAMDTEPIRSEPNTEGEGEDVLGDDTDFFEPDILSEAIPIGYIKVVASTGREAFPIADAIVRIYKKNADSIAELIAVMQTDRSGNTEPLGVETVDGRNSLIPNPPVLPYSLFDISVAANGFYDQYFSDVRVFENQTTLQNAKLIPLSFEDEISVYPLRRTDVFPFGATGDL